MSLLTKSKYTRAVQCPKMLWMDLNKPEQGIDKSDPGILANGGKIGDFAKSYYGPYVEVPLSNDEKEMCEITANLMNAGTPVICEASFLYDDCFCRVDILRKAEDGYELVEVKSSSGVKDIYLEDVAYQYYVLMNCGVPVVRTYIMYVNTQYVREGALDIKQLFARDDLTEKCKLGWDSVEKTIAATKAYLSRAGEPESVLGPYCEKPYECAYSEYCYAAKGITSPSILDIGGMQAKKKFALLNDGIITYADILNNRKKCGLNAKQLIQVNEYVNRSPAYIKKEEIKKFLDTLTYPLYHLDFETFQQSIPEYDGISPYAQIPFQYSLHVQKSPCADPEHYEFLGKEGTDPRRALAEQLCKDIPAGVCVLAYHCATEKGIIRKLADTFPDLHDHLMAIYGNVKDLMDPFSKYHYYTKEMGGSFSIKSVLPALCGGDPELDYHALEGVHNGGEAMTVFADLANHTPEEIGVIRKQLLAYCRLDTLAMVKVLEKLYEAVK